MSAVWLAAAGTLVAMVMAYVFLRKRNKGGVERSVPADTVLLHQLSRGPFAPSISPFCLKLETFLRMADIPYKNAHGRAMGPKGKVPWVQLNGETLADSHLIIAALNQRFSKSLSKHLDPATRAAVSALVKLCEEHLFWGVVVWRCHYDESRTTFRLCGLSAPVIWLVSRKGRGMAWSHGMGRFSREESLLLIEQDLQAVADFLGEKAFLAGQQPCEEDCAVFGHLAQLLWHMPGTPLESLIQDKFPSLVSYCERMRTTFWPDWDDCITHGGTRPASK